jgi:hypothetical protein
MEHDMKASHAAAFQTLPTAAKLDATSSQRTLETLFRHPSAQNLDWNDALALFGAIGRVVHRSHDMWVLELGGAHQLIHQSHDKYLTGAEVIELRKFLHRAGWSADGAVDAPTATEQHAPFLLAAVDHHEAKIYAIGADPHDATRQEIKPYDPHQFLHHLAHKDQHRERGQRAPEDPSFYVRIKAALSHAGELVVVGHGPGQSNAAHHLIEHLAAHDPEIYARVVAETVVNLSSVTPAQLLDIGEEAVRR